MRKFDEPIGAPLKKLRVLLIAEAANPEWTSVPLIGWNLFLALARVADVHLVTQVRNRDAIIRKGLVEGQDFTAIDNENIAAPLNKISEKLRGGSGKGWTTISAFSSLAYYSFETKLWRHFRRRLAKHDFDIVHRITPLSPTSQSIIGKRLSKLKIPFVIGPLNGGVPWPKSFRNRQYAEREWLSHARWLFKLMPGYNSTRRYASAIIVGSRHTLGEMPEWVRKKCIYIPENGIDLDRFSNPRNFSVSLPLRAVFLGRLVPYKGADMLLEAAAPFLRAGDLELHIIGEGPQRHFLTEMVEKLDVAGKVRFEGWIPHAKIQEKLRTFDFLVLPSIREFGGGVVVEAMALGVTPIVADYGGPAELVDEATGFRISFTDKNSLVEGIRRAIGEILLFPEVLNKLGPAARERTIENLSWDAKANQILKIYREILAGTNDLNFLDHR
jgi:glycosyltransferase involved in cell wall biosynthesis